MREILIVVFITMMGRSIYSLLSSKKNIERTQTNQQFNTNQNGLQTQQPQHMNDAMQRQQELGSKLQRQQLEEFNRECMDFSIKSITPFEHGGFDMNQGNSFNQNNNMFH